MQSARLKKENPYREPREHHLFQPKAIPHYINGPIHLASACWPKEKSCFCQIMDNSFPEMILENYLTVPQMCTIHYNIVNHSRGSIYCQILSAEAEDISAFSVQYSIDTENSNALVHNDYSLKAIQIRRPLSLSAESQVQKLKSICLTDQQQHLRSIPKCTTPKLLSKHHPTRKSRKLLISTHMSFKHWWNDKTDQQEHIKYGAQPKRERITQLTG